MIFIFPIICAIDPHHLFRKGFSELEKDQPSLLKAWLYFFHLHKEHGYGPATRIIQTFYKFKISPPHIMFGQNKQKLIRQSKLSQSSIEQIINRQHLLISAVGSLNNDMESKFGFASLLQSKSRQHQYLNIYRNLSKVHLELDLLNRSFYNEKINFELQHYTRSPISHRIVEERQITNIQASQDHSFISLSKIQNLALQFQLGFDGVKRNRSRGYALFQSISDRNPDNQFANHQLGLKYLKGEYSQRNFTKAYQYFQRVTSKKYSTFEMMTFMKFKGLGTLKNQKAALGQLNVSIAKAQRQESLLFYLGLLLLQSQNPLKLQFNYLLSRVLKAISDHTFPKHLLRYANIFLMSNGYFNVNAQIISLQYKTIFENTDLWEEYNYDLVKYVRNSQLRAAFFNQLFQANANIKHAFINCYYLLDHFKLKLDINYDPAQLSPQTLNEIENDFGLQISQVLRQYLLDPLADLPISFDALKLYTEVGKEYFVSDLMQFCIDRIFCRFLKAKQMINPEKDILDNRVIKIFETILQQQFNQPSNKIYIYQINYLLGRHYKANDKLNMSAKYFGNSLGKFSSDKLREYVMNMEQGPTLIINQIGGSLLLTAIILIIAVFIALRKRKINLQKMEEEQAEQVQQVEQQNEQENDV